ncbi:MAG TPA: hypothetical protein VHY35_18250 [Stellaceae bacterium]|jgi:hypothetical protein|nr:hypothetical protein [Stellaceae bacterium]
MRSISAKSAALGFVLAIAATAQAAEPQHCVRPDIILWGDGKHDDTEALNAWLHGADAEWAATGDPVGNSISGHDFRLSAAIYVSAGADRRLENFHLTWPDRGETVSGGTIQSTADPAQAPVTAGISIVGGDGGEGKPFDAPDPAPAAQNPQASCAIS